MEPESVLKYIPQQPPFVMVDNIIYCDLECCRTNFKVREDNLLLSNGKLLEAGLLENIAQSCAARIGYVCLHIKHEPIKVGVIGAVKNFHLYSKPLLNEVIETEVSVISEFFNMMVLDAKVYCNSEVMAECEMKVALLD